MEGHETATEEDDLQPGTFAPQTSNLSKGASLPLVYAYITFL